MSKAVSQKCLDLTLARSRSCLRRENEHLGLVEDLGLASVWKPKVLVSDHKVSLRHCYSANAREFKHELTMNAESMELES